MARILAALLSLVAAPAWGSAWLMANPGSVDFGTVTVNQPLTSRTVYLNNYGSDPATGLSIFGFCGSEFQIYDQCFGDLRPNSSCPIQINFLAGQAAELNCSIDIYSVGSGSIRVPIHATVIEEPEQPEQ